MAFERGGPRSRPGYEDYLMWLLSSSFGTYSLSGIIILDRGTSAARTSGATTSATPSTPPGRNDTPTTPTTPKDIATEHTTRPLTGPLTAAVPEDVAKICGIPNGHADALTTALSIVYKADDRVGAAVDTILQRLFYTVISQVRHAATIPPPATTAAPAMAANPPPTYASRVTSQTTPML
ncbi:hypothetical protein Sste5344_008702 [Sporothrix stenoceras]